VRAPSRRRLSLRAAAAAIVLASPATAVVGAAVAEPTEIFLIAATPGQAAQAAAEVERLGGSIDERIDAIGYLRATAPAGLIDHVRGSAAVAAVELVRHDPSNTCSKAEEADPVDLRAPFPAEVLERGSALIPVNDLGVRAFQRDHPTYDGRGVGIAILEGCGNQIADMLNPSLQHAMLADGTYVPKMAGLINPAAWRPLEQARPGYVVVAQAADPVGQLGAVRLEGIDYAPPAEASWSGGVYRASNGLDYGVLWRSGDPRIWVDTDRDRDFGDETPLADINAGFSAGRLAGAGDETQISLAVQFHQSGQAILIYEGNGAHQTMTAGAAAAHDLAGGDAGAAAPMARLVIVTPGSWSRADLLEAYIAAARDPRVDIISESWGLQSWSGVSGIILDRLVSEYGVVILHAAGNSGPVMNSLEAENETASDVLSIGGYQGSDTAHAFFGLAWSMPDSLWLGSSRGPTLGGRIKPDLVAPLNMVTTRPCSSVQQGDEQGVRMLYRLPPCYRLGGGTSAATPAAAGAVAALLSGLRQEIGRDLDVRRLLWALRMSARRLDGYGVYEQGYGLLDIPAAWALLQTDQLVPEFEVEAPLAHEDVRFYYDRPVGRGLFEREGWTAGQSEMRTLRITRTSGPAGSLRFRLGWRGNPDDTFGATEAVDLPLGETVDLPVRIHPRAFGAHSAMLELRDDDTGAPVFAIGATVVAAHRFADGALEADVPVRWPDGGSAFLDVPAGADLLEITVTAGARPVGLALGAPGRWTDPAQASAFGAATPILGAGEVRTIRIESPLKGVWELRVASCATGLQTYQVCADPAEGAARETSVRLWGTVTDDVIE
jgi:hypothetical protein